MNLASFNAIIRLYHVTHRTSNLLTILSEYAGEGTQELAAMWKDINAAVEKHLSRNAIGAREMKSETYDALADFNCGIDVALESLTVLAQKGIWTADYVQQQREIFEQHRAGVNRLAHNRLQASATEDEEHFGKMRETTARRLRGEQTVEGLPPKS